MDWEFLAYGGAEHAFSNPDVGRYGIPGVAYDERADKRSLAAMYRFLNQVFAR